ncbi:hypothetical protein, partial [Bacillus pumilus]|uniref:hypothetical protein n=1 Tax=Bacillus pumilus TaxID=1408 RepID=UPI001C930B6C
MELDVWLWKRKWRVKEIGWRFYEGMWGLFCFLYGFMYEVIWVMNGVIEWFERLRGEVEWLCGF